MRNHKPEPSPRTGTATVPEHPRARVRARGGRGIARLRNLLASAGVTDVEDLLVLSDAVLLPPPRHAVLRRRVAGAPGVYHFVDVSGLRSTSGRPRPALTRGQHARRSAKVQRMVMPLAAGVRSFPTASVLGACAGAARDITHWHRHTTQRSTQAVISTGSCAKQIVPSWSPASVSLTYPGSAFGTRCTRHAGGKLMRALGAKTRRPLLHRQAVALRRSPFPALTAVMTPWCPRASSRSAARARDKLSAYMAGVEPRDDDTPILAAPRIVWGARRDR